MGGDQITCGARNTQVACMVIKGFGDNHGDDTAQEHGFVLSPREAGHFEHMASPARRRSQNRAHIPAGAQHAAYDSRSVAADSGDFLTHRTHSVQPGTIHRLGRDAR